MGLGVSLPMLDGALIVYGTTAVLLTSYAFSPIDTNKFGTQVIYNPGPFVQPGNVFPIATFPLKDGSPSTVTCGATVALNPGTMSTASITCPIANTLIGVGTASINFQFPHGTELVPPTALISFTAADPTTATVTTPASTTVTNKVTVTADPKTVTLTDGTATEYTGCTTTGRKGGPVCRPITRSKDNSNNKYERRDAGYGGPDTTLRAGQTLSRQTVTTTAEDRKTVTELSTVTVTASTITVGQKTTTTIKGCPPETWKNT